MCTVFGGCGEAGCEDIDHLIYYGPPGCQRLKKSLNQTDFVDQEAYIQAYRVSMMFTWCLTLKMQNIKS